MNRRDFLTVTASAATALTALALAGRARAADSAAPAGALPAATGGKPGKQLIELRTYHFASTAKQEAFIKFMADAAVPGLNRAGVQPVGVFRALGKDNAPPKPAKGDVPAKPAADPTNLYVLLPHPSHESALTLADRLADDDAFQKAGQAVLNTPKSDPAYARYESSLLLAFDEFPQVQVPAKADGRLMQLRVYESHTEERGLAKVRMFDAGGEVAIFRKVGLTGVFFGRAIAGPNLPNLTYMLAFDDEQARDRAWNAFRDHPEWKSLSKDPAYKDSTSKITNLVLRPAAGSQV